MSDSVTKITSDTLDPVGGAIPRYSKFGFSMTAIGDLDGDGAIDLAIGGPHRGYYPQDGPQVGSVWILFLNFDSTVKCFSEINPSSFNETQFLWDEYHFGYSLASLGDLDGDGAIDLAVGAIGAEDRDRFGVVWILFLTRDGRVKEASKIVISNMADLQFGYSLANLGDLDGDGVIDIAVGQVSYLYAWTEVDPLQAVYIIFLNSNGTIKSYQSITSSNITTLEDNDDFGAAVANIGDLDGDGVTDIAVGAPGYAGAVWIVFLRSTGDVKGYQRINATRDMDENEEFGVSVECLGDLDGDEVADLAVGTNRDSGNSWDPDPPGRVWIIFLNSDGTLKSLKELTFSEVLDQQFPNFPSQSKFGYSMASLRIGENKTMENDLVIGAPNYAHGNISRQGAIFTLSFTCNLPEKYCPPRCELFCQPCPKFYYAPESSTLCSLCQDGTEVDTDENATSCIPCRDGRHRTVLETQMCESCPPYYRMDQFMNQTRCLLCPEGQEPNSLENATLCVDCPERSVRMATHVGPCAQCPETMLVDDSQSSCNLCWPGTLTNSPINPTGCIDCPKGMYCITTNHSTPCPHGTFGLLGGLSRQDQCVECKVSSRCQEGNVCTLGYAGDMCIECMEGYFSIKGSCIECKWSPFPIAGVVIFAILMILILIKVDFPVDRTTQLKVLVNFVQVLVLVVSSVKVELPPVFKQIVAFLQIALIDMNILSPECYMEVTWYQTFLGTLLAIGASFGALFLLIGIIKLQLFWFFQKDSQKVEYVVKLWRRKRNVWKFVSLGILFLYLPLTNQFLETFDCVKSVNAKEEKTRILLSDPSIACYSDPYHILMVVLSILLLIIITVGFPLLIWFHDQVTKQRNAVSNSAAFSVVSGSYKREYAAFEIETLVRKSTITFVALFLSIFNASLVVAACLMFAISFIHLLVFIFTRPYRYLFVRFLFFKVDAFNSLEIFNSFGICVLLGCLFLQGILGDDEMGDGLLMFLGITMCTIVILSVLFTITKLHFDFRIWRRKKAAKTPKMELLRIFEELKKAHEQRNPIKGREIIELQLEQPRGEYLHELKFRQKFLQSCRKPGEECKQALSELDEEIRELTPPQPLDTLIEDARERLKDAQKNQEKIRKCLKLNSKKGGRNVKKLQKMLQGDSVQTFIASICSRIQGLRNAIRGIEENAWKHEQLKEAATIMEVEMTVSRILSNTMSLVSRSGFVVPTEEKDDHHEVSIDDDDFTGEESSSSFVLSVKDETDELSMDEIFLYPE